MPIAAPGVFDDPNSASATCSSREKSGSAANSVVETTTNQIAKQPKRIFIADLR